MVFPPLADVDCDQEIDTAYAYGDCDFFSLPSAVELPVAEYESDRLTSDDRPVGSNTVVCTRDAWPMVCPANIHTITSLHSSWASSSPALIRNGA